MGCDFAHEHCTYSVEYSHAVCGGSLNEVRMASSRVAKNTDEAAEHAAKIFDFL